MNLVPETLDSISLSVDQKINHNYPKLLNMPILNTAYNRVYIPRLIIFGTLKPVEIEISEIRKTLWIKMEKLNENTMNNLEDLGYHSKNNNELSTLSPSPQSSF